MNACVEPDLCAASEATARMNGWESPGCGGGDAAAAAGAGAEAGAGAGGGAAASSAARPLGGFQSLAMGWSNATWMWSWCAESEKKPGAEIGHGVPTSLGRIAGSRVD